MGKKRSHQVTRSILKSFPAEAEKVLAEREAGSAAEDEREFLSEDGSSEGESAEDGVESNLAAESEDDGFSDVEADEYSMSEDAEEDEDDPDSIEDLKRRKKAKKVTAEVDLGSVISGILSEKTKEAPILARRKGIEKKIEDERLEARARSVVKKELRARKDAAHQSVPDMSRANYERQLKKAGTKGVVQLFNAIHQHQVMKEKMVKEKAAAGSGQKAAVAAQIKQISKTSFLDMLKGGASAQLKKTSEPTE